MKVAFHNLFTHFVFTTQNRLPLIAENRRIRIEKYFTGIVNNHDSKLYAIYANPEHVHLLISRSARISEEAIASVIADSSERFINENQLCLEKFAWQQSASAFSVSKAHLDNVCKYILNQPEHHKKVTFAEEYDSFIKHYQKGLRWQ